VKSLYLRIYATMIVVLLLFAALSGAIFQRQIEEERGRAQSMLAERMGAWAELIQRSLPGPEASVDSQAGELREWSQRLRLPLALDSASGERIAASESFLRRQADGARSTAIKLEDGRTLWVMRPGRGPGGARMNRPDGAGGADGGRGSVPLPFLPPAWQRGFGLVIVLVILFVAVAAGAYPVVRRLTRRLEALKRGVEQFGAGQLGHRVAISGHDEVAAVAASFNTAAERVETLVRSHQSLLANASHELRSPLARMKMAVSMLDGATPAQREKLKREIDTNVGELDALVEEVLLASRLEATAGLSHPEPIDLLGLAVEEGARVQATVEGGPATIVGDERLVRRALRNLLENARRYGGAEIVVSIVAKPADGGALISVCDRGPGVPEAMRERIFEPFFRLPGHAEQAGGVGLGLSLVKQIAERHGGHVRCEAREGGGSRFVLDLPARPDGGGSQASVGQASSGPRVTRSA
jgi:signal transduction histidine kinase